MNPTFLPSWQCPGCGSVGQGLGLPDKCPTCGIYFDERTPTPREIWEAVQYLNWITRRAQRVCDILGLDSDSLEFGGRENDPDDDFRFRRKTWWQTFKTLFMGKRIAPRPPYGTSR